MASHYSLKVSRVQDVVRKGLRSIAKTNPNLFVEVKLGNSIQKTNTVKDNIAPSWGETLPLVWPTESSHLFIRLIHKSKIKFIRDEVIGCAEVELSKLLDDCKDGECKLSVFSHPNSEPTGTIVYHLKASDVQANATLALQNLMRNLPQGPLSSCTSAEEVVDKADKLVAEGKNAIKENTDLIEAFKNTIPAIDVFVTTMDKITEANPYLKLAWYMTSGLYKIVSAQVKADEKFRNMVETLVKLFSFVKDAKDLRDILGSFQSTIAKLLDIIIEGCLLLRNHARHSFASRSLNASDKAKIDNLEKSLNDLKSDLSDGFVRHTAKIAEHIAAQADVLRVFQKLGTSPKDDGDASKRSICFEDTQASILNDIKEWVSSGSSQNILWLNGVAGSGKSTVTTTIAKEFRASSLGAYLLFERGKSEPGTIFRTISCKLADSNLALASRIFTACNSHKDISSLSDRENFEILFKDILLSADDVAGPVLIILDGLDECGSSTDRRNLMHWLEHDFSSLPSKFRFLITSRPEDDIVRALTSKSHILEVNLDHSSDSSRRDVQAYLDYALRNVITEKEPEGWNWKTVSNTLGKAANGLFIWASTLVKFISDQMLKFKQLKALASNPNSHTPEGLYATVFGGSINWDEKNVPGGSTASFFSRIFGLILFGKQPFSNEDIDRLLGLGPDEKSDSLLSKLQSVIAYVPGKPIHLHHTSFSDYLTSTHCRSSPWFIDADHEKQMIASRCFDVMDDLRFNICGLETSFILNKDVTDLDDRIKRNMPTQMIYACRFWAQHLREVPFSEELLERLSTFAYNHLLHWFEVLSLTNNYYYQVGQALQDAIEWTRDKKLELSGFLGQAINLASTFAVPITESTAHIYVSMIALTKNDSDVSAHYSQKTPLLSLVAVERVGIKPTSSLLKRFDGHTGSVNSVQFSPDGKRAVSGSRDKTVLVWDVESGKVVAGPFKGHSDEVTSVQFSSDGKRVVSGSDDRTVLVWDVDGGKVIAGPFEGHSGRVTSVGFSSDGKRVVSGSYDNTVLVWDVESGKVVAGPFEGHSHIVASVGFSSDGKRVVSGSYDKTVLVWDVESGNVVAGPFEGHSEPVSSVQFSSDGKRIVSGSWDKTVLVWDVESGNVVAGPLERHSHRVTSVQFSSDGKRVVSGSYDKTVLVWDVESGKVVAGPLEGHTHWVASVGFSSNGKHVVSGSLDKTVLVWDVESGKVAAGPFKGHSGGVTSVQFSSDGKRVVSGSYDKTVLVWDVESGKVVAGPFKGHSDVVFSVQFSSDGKRVVSGSVDKTVLVWDVESGKVVAGPFKGHSDVVFSVQFSSDGKRVVSGSRDKTVLVWDVESGKVVAGPFKGHSDIVVSVGFSSDGKRVVSGSCDKTVLVWDVESGKVVAGPFEGHSDEVNSVQFSSDGKRVVSGSDDNTVLVWDVESGKVVAGPFVGHSDRVISVQFSSDGRRVVSGSWDGTVLVWNVESGKVLAGPFEGHSDGVNSVEFSSDGKRVVSGSRDGRILVWDIESGEPISGPFGELGSTSTLGPLSRDGKFLITKSDDENMVPSEDLSDWSMLEDSWIRTKEGKLLLWIPPDLRLTLWRAHDVSILNCRFSTKLDFTSCDPGGKWYK